MSAPLDVKALRRAVEDAAARRAVGAQRMQYTVASTVALQMVPDGAAKGGGAIRHRVNEAAARLTTDLDFARATGMDLDTFVDAYSDQLESGWPGFTGVLKAEKSKRPDDVPDEYVMDRFSIKLRYHGQPYCSVILELVHAEIDSTDTAVERLGTDIAAIFDELGLPRPAPVRVISAEHQIVQKLHACTGELRAPGLTISSTSRSSPPSRTSTTPRSAGSADVSSRTGSGTSGHPSSSRTRDGRTSTLRRSTTWRTRPCSPRSRTLSTSRTA